MTLEVSPDGKSLLSQREQGNFTGIDVATGKMLRQFQPGRPRGQERKFSPDGRTVAVAERKKTGRVIRWDFATGKKLPRLGTA